ncbi:MAG: hypothetical protein LHW59_05445 [Candidatus Cloacimonetes bacterium]|jgi:hypothetical protein|nr:hypothetical protein [Candidatus Cloacimonadota bacterium]
MAVTSAAVGLKTAEVVTSASFIGIGLFTVNIELIVLASVGLIISLFSYHYDYEKCKDCTKHKISEISKYMLFGAGAFPASYAMAGKVTDDVSIRLFAGLFVAYHIIQLLDTVVIKVKKLIEDWRL